MFVKALLWSRLYAYVETTVIRCGMSNLPYDISRSDPAMSRAADQVHALIALHPEGVTFSEFMQAHRYQISVEDAAIASIQLLLHEGKVYSNEPWSGGGFIHHVKLFARA